MGKEKGRLKVLSSSACIDYLGGLATATRVRCPVSLVLARQNQMTLPRAAAEVARLLRATVHDVPDGHFLMREQPDAALAALRWPAPTGP